MAGEGTKQMPSGPGMPGGRTMEEMQKMMQATYEYKGTIFPKLLSPRECVEAMETFEVRDDDIFVLTYPKCGTHWAMEIVYLILTDGYPDKIDRVEKMKFGGLEMALPTCPLPGYKFVETIQTRRVLPTHLPENLLPPPVFKNKGKVLFVTRNPKDCLTSMFRFFINQGVQKDGPDAWNQMFGQFLSKNMLGGNFWDFTLAYWKHRHDDNFLFLKYEDMKRDTRSAVIAIADHIGCVLSEEAIDRVVENCGIEQMKKSYQKADEQGIMPPLHGTGKESLVKFIRKGAAGDWKNYFTVAQNEMFDEYCREKLTGSGLKFDFE